jgi:excisionase family DNA binding protein
MALRRHFGQRRKVAEARRVVQLVLGDAVRSDHPQVAKYVPTAQAEPVQARDESVHVLSLGEVAARLGISRGEVERMIAAGKMQALETGFTLRVPSTEVERLRRA